MARPKLSAPQDSSIASEASPEPTLPRPDESSRAQSLKDRVVFQAPHPLDDQTVRIIKRLRTASREDLILLVRPFVEDMGIRYVMDWFNNNTTFMNIFRSKLTWEGDTTFLFYSSVKKSMARQVVSEEILLRVLARDAFLRAFIEYENHA